MGQMASSIGMTVATSSCAEAPNYDAIWGATGDSVASLQGQSFDVIASAEEDRALMADASAFEQSKISEDWEKSIRDIERAETQTMSKTGFASSGLVEQEFDLKREDVAGEISYKAGAQELELEKAIRQSESSTQQALANIESQINQYMTSFAGATGYEWQEGGPPVESVGCMGNIERDESYG